MVLAERAIEGAAQGSKRIQGNLKSQAQWRADIEKEGSGENKKYKKSSHFLLLPQIGIQGHLEQKQSLTAQTGVLGSGKGRKRQRKPYFQMLRAYLLTI